MKKKYMHFDKGTGEGGFTEKEMQEVVAAIAEKHKAFEESIKNQDGQHALLLKEIADIRQEGNDKRYEAMAAKYDAMLLEQGTDITSLKENGVANVTGKHAALSDMIVKGIKDNADKIKEAVEAGRAMTFAIKAAGTMTITNNYSGGTVGLSDLEPSITRVQRRRPFLRQIVNVGGTTSKYVVWIEQANPDPGVAGMVAEGAAKPQTDFDLVERSAEVRKIAVWIKVSKEMLADIPFIEAEIRQELMELVELKLDEQILSGDGNAPAMSGIVEYAPSYSGGTFAGTIPAANRFDVLRTAIAQIEAANFFPTHIILNPLDVAAMELTKDTMGNYMWPYWATRDTLHGVTIIANNGVTPGTFIVGDFTKAMLRIREDMNIQVGFVNDDFTRNLVTILAEMRAVFFIKTNHFGAFVQGDFDEAIAALLLEPAETP